MQSDSAKPTIWLIGPIAAGKSHHVKNLAGKSRWPVFAIDAYRKQHGNAAWDQMLNDLRLEPGPAIVESVLLPEPAIELATERKALVCRVDCPEPERKRRVSRRGWKYARPAAWTDFAELADVVLPGVRTPDKDEYERLIRRAEGSEQRAVAVQRAPRHSRDW